MHIVIFWVTVLSLFRVSVTIFSKFDIMEKKVLEKAGYKKLALHATLTLKRALADLKVTNESDFESDCAYRDMPKAKLAQYETALVAFEDAVAKLIGKAIEQDIEESDMQYLVTWKANLNSECNDIVVPLKSKIFSAVQNTCDTNLLSETSKSGTKFKLPELKLPTFSDCSSGHFEYLNFSSTFTNTISLIPNLSPAVKFMYLKNCLQGKALSLIENLPVSESVYDEAWNLLDGFFKDTDKIVNLIFSDINHKVCNNVKETEAFIVKVQQKKLELNKLEVTFVNDSAGEKLLSHIVRGKLPKFFVQEIVRKTNTNYPSTCQIEEHYINIIKMFATNKSDSNVVYSGVDVEAPSVGKTSVKHNTHTSHSTKTNSFNTNPGCKFCGMSNHSSVHCKRFGNYPDRLARVKELNRCSLCLRTKHEEASCLGKTNKLLVMG